LFSNYENLPCVIAEAFAAGIPVLSTNVGGISEFFNEKLGILIEVKNETELLSSLNKMLDKQGEFDNSYIHKYAKENFSYDVIGKELLQIYQETLKLKQIG
jgi:glycosyltransferase involved in cell wall biosynthesis